MSAFFFPAQIIDTDTSGFIEDSGPHISLMGLHFESRVLRFEMDKLGFSEVMCKMLYH